MSKKINSIQTYSLKIKNSDKYIEINAPVLASTYQINLPTSTSSDDQILYVSSPGNFNLQDPTFKSSVFNLVDGTKTLDFDVSAISNSTIRTYTIPNQDITLVNQTSAQTLTNKTFRHEYNYINTPGYLCQFHLNDLTNSFQSMYLTFYKPSFPFDLRWMKLPTSYQLTHYTFIQDDNVNVGDTYDLEISKDDVVSETITNILNNDNNSYYGALTTSFNANQRLSCRIRNATATRNEETIVIIYGYSK